MIAFIYAQVEHGHKWNNTRKVMQANDIEGIGKNVRQLQRILICRQSTARNKLPHEYLSQKGGLQR